MKNTEVPEGGLLVDISDALSERDRVRFTVHTRTKLPQFNKQVMSVVRQHEEFIWLHDCLEDNDQYAGYIIPPPPPRPDFDSSRDKLQRLGDGEMNMSKDEFAKMKQELEAEYLAIFKKTVAMHEMFLQRLAAHEKFRNDHNFKIFLEYENELAVRSKSKKERIAGSIQNIGKSLTDFVITTSQVAASTSSASTAILAGHSPRRQSEINRAQQQPNGNTSSHEDYNQQPLSSAAIQQTDDHKTGTSSDSEPNGDARPFNNNLGDSEGNIDEQYFEKERLFLALYHNSIRETAIQADRVSRAQRMVADDYLHIAQQLVKLASIEILPITSQTKDSSSYVACQLPSLTLPDPSFLSSGISDNNHTAADTSSSSLSTMLNGNKRQSESDLDLVDDYGLGDSDEIKPGSPATVNISSGSIHDTKSSDILLHSEGEPRQGCSKSFADPISSPMDSAQSQARRSTGGCVNEPTSENLKQMLLNVSDYLEQARKTETRIASDEDLKLTDTFLYYKRDTVAAQDLLVRRLRFMSEYETATRNLERARQKGRTQMQYADVIQKQARENFISISKLAKQELIDYKQRRVTSFKKSFNDLVELELKHLRSHSQLIANCLDTCRGIGNCQVPSAKNKTSHKQQ